MKVSEFLFNNVEVFLGVLGARIEHDRQSTAVAFAAGALTATGLGALQRRAMRRDQVLAEVPLVLDDLLADGAGDALGLDVHVHNVLLEVEAVGESLPAVVADAGLHAAPSVARVGDSCSRCRQLLLLMFVAWLQLLLGQLTVAVVRFIY